MKNTFYILILSLISLTSCVQNQEESKVSNKSNDIIVLKENIPLDLNNQQLKINTLSYSIVTKNKKSDYEILISNRKNYRGVSIYTNYDLRKGKKGKTYKERLNEFEYILNTAKNDFKLDSLTSIYIGRLISNGDLAINLTALYNNTFGRHSNVSDYNKISNLLMNSKLVHDFNILLEPYSKKISDVNLEKITFSTKQDLISSSVLSTDTVNVPSRILDCWVDMKVSNK